MTIQEHIAELKELEAKAAPRPWYMTREHTMDDWRLIIVMRDALPELIAEIERLYSSYEAGIHETMRVRAEYAEKAYEDLNTLLAFRTEALEVAEARVEKAEVELAQVKAERDILAEKLEEKEPYCCVCDHFTPDYSTPESVGDSCINYGVCTYSWNTFAVQEAKLEDMIAKLQEDYPEL